MAINYAHNAAAAEKMARECAQGGNEAIAVQGDVAAWFGSVPAVPAACKGDELLTDAGCDTNGYQNFDKIWFWRTPTAKCEKESGCVPYSQWAKDYIAILGK